MLLFFHILIRLLPLYINIVLGYAAGKLLKASAATLAKLSFYILTPIVIFGAVAQTKLEADTLFLPILIFCLCSSLSLIFLAIGSRYWQDSTKNILGLSAGYGNAGTFGLPIAIFLFSSQGVGVYVMALFGMMLYESTVGFYIMGRGSLSPTVCFQKIIKLPSLYAFGLAIAVNYSGWELPSVAQIFVEEIRCTYTTLGMMLVGLSLSTLPHLRLDWRFVSLTFIAKFLAWPASVLALIALDTHFWHLYTNTVYKALILISIVPITVNTTVLAAIFDAKPEKAATSVLCSTLFALLYIPLISVWTLMS